MGEGATIVDTANVTQWFREGFMRNLGNGLKGVFANLQWAESEVPNRTLLDVSDPSFRFNLGRKSLVGDVKMFYQHRLTCTFCINCSGIVSCQWF